jgi:hypothetical protein
MMVMLIYKDESFISRPLSMSISETMVFETIGLGVALLLAPAIAEYAKIRHKADKGFNWLAASGVFFLFASTFTVAGIWGLDQAVWMGIGTVFEVVGWLLALVGTIFVGYQILWVEK